MNRNTGCDVCGRPIVEDDEGFPQGPECGYPNGKSCKEYAKKSHIQKNRYLNQGI